MTSRFESLLAGRPEAIAFVMQGAYLGLGFLITILLARLLGPDNAGLYFQVVAWLLLISSAIQIGWGPFLIREVAVLREQGRAGELRGIVQVAIATVALIGIAAGGLFIAVAWSVVDTELQRLTYAIAAPAILLIGAGAIWQVVTRALGRPLLGQLCDYIARPVVQFVGLALVWFGVIVERATAKEAMAIFVLAVGTSALLAWILERWAVRANVPRERAIMPPVRHWIGSLLTNSLIGWLGTLNQQIGTILLGAFVATSEIANFRIALQLSVLLGLGLAAVNAIYGKDFARLVVLGDYEAIQAQAIRSSRFSVMIALPIAAIFVFFGRPLIAQLFGDEFSGAYLPLAILIVGQLANAAFGSVLSICVATRNEGAGLTVQALAVLGNVGISIGLAPFLGTIAFAIGMAASLVFWNAMLFLFLKRKMGIVSFPFVRNGRRPLPGKSVVGDG